MRVFEANISIRLYGEGLVELRRERKTQCHDVAAVQPVERTAFPSEPRVSHAVRLSGFCGRHSCAPRPSPGLAGWRGLWACSQVLRPLFFLGEYGHAKLQ